MKRTLMIAGACCALGVLALVAPAAIVAEAAEGTMIRVSQKEPYGKFLTDTKGMSLYLFEADSKNTTTCYDACAKAWPPLLTEGGVGERVPLARLRERVGVGLG